MARSIPLAAAALAAALLPAPAARAGVPLQLPEPVVLARAVDVDKVRDAILVSAARRKWITESDVGDAFVVRLNVRRHVLRLRVEYEPRKVRFVYVDSENLDYEIEDGVPTIHRKVNQWVEALSLEIQRELQLAVFAGERLDIVEPAATSPAAAPAPPPPPAAPPATPPPPAAALATGGTATTRARTPVRGRPMQDAEAVVELPAGATVQLVSSTRNLTGTWWYVNTGHDVGWVAEAALRP